MDLSETPARAHTVPLAPDADAVLARRRDVVCQVTARELLDDAQPLCAVLDLDTLDELVAALVNAYPDELQVLHTVAAKAIALRPVLQHFAEMGLGCEVASPGELHLALGAGFDPARIIYDSPAKTITDLRQALSLGVTFNVDNFEELSRVDALVGEFPVLPVIGMRINPQSGAGTIQAMSTATHTSKFGIGLADFRGRIVSAFVERPWLQQLHVHSGSQGLALEHTAADVASIVELAEEIERAAGEQRVKVIDVGGGLSVNFTSDETTPTFDDHARALREAAPELFSGKYWLATEFGRSLTAKAGTLIGRVEYVKQAGDRMIAVTPIGVQVATRTVFMPRSWPLRIEVYDEAGKPRSGATARYDVAGPACFAGDLIAEDRELPVINAGDLIAVPDTGGYYASNHFGYNSLLRPAIYAVRGDGDRRPMSIVRRAQTLEELAAESGEIDLSATV